MCVQNFDDSRGPAIRITYRISLRSSSLWDPRHPLLKVVMNYTTKRTPQRAPKAVLVQFKFYLVMGGTTTSQPAVKPGPAAAPRFLIYVNCGGKEPGPVRAPRSRYRFTGM